MSHSFSLRALGRYAYAATLASAAQLVFAQRAQSLSPAWRYDPAVATSVERAVAHTAAQLNASAKAPGRSVRLEPVGRVSGPSGMRHLRYRELGPGGHPVLGAQLVVHAPAATATGGEALTATASVVAADRFEVTGSAWLSAARARSVAEAELSRALGAARFRDSDSLDDTHLCYVPRGLDFDGGKYRLAYRVDAYPADRLAREYVFVDAETAEVLARLPRLHSAAGPIDHAAAHRPAPPVVSEEAGTAETRYHGTREIVTERRPGGDYRLRQADHRGTVVHTRDAGGGDGFAYVEFLDDDNEWAGVTEAQDEVARDAFWASGRLLDLLDESFGWHSIDDAGFPLIANVHVGDRLANAFWNGAESYYGDGEPGGVIGAPLTAIDVVGHEFAHGLTEFSAGLIYYGESGALNESFSDIFGVALRHYALPERAGDYSIGSDMDPGGVGFRSMSEPNRHRHPDTYGGDFYYEGTLDNGGVHLNSGVQNHWFYLLAEGGTGVNDLGVAFDVAGIGTADALAVAHLTLTAYLTPESSYPEAAAASVQAATELFGFCDARAASVREAWRAVGLLASGEGGVYGSASTYRVCESRESVSFHAGVAEGAEVTWDFGDGTTASGVDVEHVFPQGIFEVAFSTASCDGQAVTYALPEPVVVDPEALSCSESRVPEDGGQAEVVTCAGYIVDGGGADGRYGNDWSGRLAVRHPLAAGGYRLSVEAFDVEAGFDYLHVIALLPGGTEELVGAYSGRDLLPGDSIFIAADATGFAVEFETDGSVTGAGFAIAFEAAGGTGRARGGVTASAGATVLVPVAFTPAAGSVGAHRYDFGDGSASAPSAAGAVVEHAYREPGRYAVTQVTTTCSSSDTAVVSVEVAPGSRACASADTAYLTLESGQSAEIDVEIANCGERELALASGTFQRALALTSSKAYAYEYASTYHELRVPPGLTDFARARLLVRYNGDYDEADEYVIVTLANAYHFSTLPLSDDGDRANGTWLEAEIPLTADVLASLRAGERLAVEVDNSDGVGVREGGTDVHEVTLEFTGRARSSRTRFSPSARLAPGEAAVATVTVDPGTLGPGVYRYAESIYTNDTARAGGRVDVPVVLTVPSRAIGVFDPVSIDLDTAYQGQTDYLNMRLRNDGTDDLLVEGVTFGQTLVSEVGLYVGDVIAPGRSRYFGVDVDVAAEFGEVRDTITLSYGGGASARLPIRATVERSGILRLGGDSTYATHGGFALEGRPFRDSITLYNDGDGELEAYVGGRYWDAPVTFEPEGVVRVAPRDSLPIFLLARAEDISAGRSVSGQVYAEQIDGRSGYGYVEYDYVIVGLPAGSLVAAELVCGRQASLAYDGDDAATVAWDFGDGGSATGVSVEHAYAASGVYVVRAEACNDLGCVTLSTRVTVRADCETVRLDGDHAPEITACSGRVTDSGGADRYGNGETYALHIAPPDGQPVVLTVVSFQTESCCDRLYVYDGANADAPLLAQWRGTVDAGTTLRSGTGGLYLAWESDRSVTRAGFELDFACADPNAVSATAQVDEACPAVVTFEAVAPRADAWTWDFGDGRAAVGPMPTHVYAKAGTHVAVVMASGADGWADTTSVAVEVALDTTSLVSIAVAGDSVAGAAQSFAVQGAAPGASPSWATSDGQTATGPVAQFTFATAGEYHVDVVAESARGCPARASHDVNVVAASGTLTRSGALDLTLVPNPAHGVVRVAGPARGSAAGARTRVYDARGRLVAEAPGLTLSVADLPAGLYAVEVRLADGTAGTRTLAVH